MCGILGSVSTDSNLTWIQEGLKRMNSRGPDNQAFVEESVAVGEARGMLAFGHTRLSIVDLSNRSNQPVWSSCGRYLMTFNGEIYNYKSIRQKCLDKGVTFLSDGDAEVLINWWALAGRDGLKELDGMFAFAIYDRVSNKVSLIRDCAGIKPLYYFEDYECFLFASIPQLLGQIWDEDQSYIFEVLAEYDLAESSFYKDVKRVQAGEYVEYNLNDKTTAKEFWWKPPAPGSYGGNYGSAIKTFKDLLFESVEMQMLADVPVGFALSGGLDSASLLAIARQIYPAKELYAFHYASRDPKCSEAYWAELVAREVDAKLVATSASDATAAFVLDAVEAQGEPFGSTSVLAQNLVMKLASEHDIKVIIEGQGADELIGGYSISMVYYLRELLIRFDARRLIRSLTGMDTGRERLWYLLQLLVITFPASVDVVIRLFMHRYLSDQRGIAGAFDSLLTLRKYRKTRSRTGLMLHGQHLQEFFNGGALEPLLRHGDRNAMQYSIENRVPFLSRGLMEFCLSLPVEYLYGANGGRKQMLRDAMKGILPEKLLSRKDKIGFGTGSDFDSVIAKISQKPVTRHWRHDLLPLIKPTL